MRDKGYLIKRGRSSGLYVPFARVAVFQSIDPFQETKTLYVPSSK